MKVQVSGSVYGRITATVNRGCSNRGNGARQRRPCWLWIYLYYVRSTSIRHGVANIFMANEPLSGKRFVEITEQKTKKDWATFIKEIADEHYPNAKKIKLVMDNFKTHTIGAFYEAFRPEEAKRLVDRFEFVFTPKHGSWLNTAYFVHSTSIAEIELRVLSGQCLNRHIHTIEKMQKEVKAWQKSRNMENCKINWQFTTKDARIKLKRLYPSFDV